MAARSIPFLILSLSYPIWQIYQLYVAEYDPRLMAEALQNYRISFWLIWVIWVVVAVWHKWTRQRNSFFKSTYAYIIFSGMVYGYYHSMVMEVTGKLSSFSDTYTASVFAALLDVVILLAITAFLQTAVWWFTRRPHRN